MHAGAAFRLYVQSSPREVEKHKHVLACRYRQCGGGMVMKHTVAMLLSDTCRILFLRDGYNHKESSSVGFILENAFAADFYTNTRTCFDTSGNQTCSSAATRQTP